MYESSQQSVCLLHNVAAPYRLPIFEKVGKNVDLTVILCGRLPNHRTWSEEVQPESYELKHFRATSVGPLSFVPRLLLYLIFHDFDEIIVNDKHELLPSTLMVLFVSLFCQFSITTWSERNETRWKRSRRSTDSTVKHFVRRLWYYVDDLCHRVVYGRSDRIISFSEDSSNYVRQRIESFDKITISPQSMPETCLEPVPDEQTNNVQVSNDKTTVIYVGQLIERKGVSTLIKSMKQLDSNEYELLIAGKGPEKEILQRHASQVDSYIGFLGYICEKEKAAYMSQCDILVLPTLHDAWGLVINEALHYGTPAVTTAAAGGRMIIPDDYIASPNDPTSLADAIKQAEESGSVTENPPTEKMVSAILCK